MSEPSIANALRRPRGVRKAAAPDAAAGAAGDGLPDTGHLETLVGYNARRAALSVIGIFLRRMAPFELRPVDYSVLSVIAHNPGVTSRQICAALDILPPNLVGMVKALQRRRLITRRPHPSDRRAQGLHLTPTGERLYREAQATASALEAEATAALTADEVQTLIALLRKVYRPGTAATGNGDAAV
ncbi:MarR family winged helix-turn-helix transcriptional regulator [Hydrogenophaga crocea]|uniref:Winged helix-turn-helix transcriptional regulator n=1 Tax=Hydrogenophaga crocea TaxID=2716225 RepID=A0A6G8IDP3_9BURK|nr:MarR family winged helix-turn-helix transcriptional regulator [Hydrogenophaga crocea]QIM51239.1 winged helix-turn-helix transcriptional regulator [Hydrogenophaga crocea]